MNLHANNVNSVSLLAMPFFSCHVIHCWYKQTHFAFSGLGRVKILAFLLPSNNYFAPCALWALNSIYSCHAGWAKQSDIWGLDEWGSTVPANQSDQIHMYNHCTFPDRAIQLYPIQWTYQCNVLWPLLMSLLEFSNLFNVTKDSNLVTHLEPWNINLQPQL